jgi:hypothetical protein
MKTIVLLTELSAYDEVLGQLALELAVKAGAEILLVHTVITETLDEVYWPPEVLLQKQEASKQLEICAAKLSRLADTEFSDFPHIDINYRCNVSTKINLADINCDTTWIIIMGMKDDEDVLSNFLYCTHASEVINQAKCPVLLINRKIKFDTLKKVALATEFEIRDIDAIKFLAQFSTYINSEIILVHDVQETLIDLEESTVRVKPSNGRFPQLFYQVIQGGSVIKDLQILSTTESFDIIGFVCKKGNLFRQIFYSQITMALIKHPHVSFFIFPE